MLEFAAAAAASEVEEDEDVVEVNLFGMPVTARRLTTAQSALLTAARTQGGAAQAASIFGAIEDMFGTAALDHVKRLIHERRIDMYDLLGGGTALNPDHGVIDAVTTAFAAGRPTQPSTASSSSRARGGQKSTGRSPGKGSTRSTSPSTPS
jgi:hypothetical protein